MVEIRNQMTHLTTLINDIQMSRENKKEQEKSKKIVKCRYEGCSKRYSSKIAMGYHLRLKHSNGKGHKDQ